LFALFEILQDWKENVPGKWKESFWKGLLEVVGKFGRNVSNIRIQNVQHWKFKGWNEYLV
jgi:hypothetical protein